MVTAPPVSHSMTPPPAPGPKNYLGWGFLGSIGFHLSLILLAFIYAIIFHISTLAELMKQGGAIAQSGPAPEEPMEITLQEDPPPPPPEHVEFARIIEPPKPIEPEKPKPVPVIKKEVAKIKPRYTAPQATGQGESESSSRAVVGSSGLPHPGYPTQARLRRQSGTVVVRVQFNGSGGVSDVEIVQSSGVTLLDSSTRSFIRSNWNRPASAGRSLEVPIEYSLNGN